MEGLSPTYNATLPAHPAGSMPLDDENKQRIEQAKQSFKNNEKTQDKLTRFLIRIADEIDNVDREKRLSLFRSQIKAHQYMDGNFRGYVDQNLEWRNATKGDDEVWYSDNQLYPYWRTALMELSRTQTEVIVNAAPGTGDEMEAAAKFAKARYDANRDRTFNARLKQTENSYALLNGITFRYTFAQFGGRKEKLPRLQKQESESTTSKMCALCAKPAIESDIVNSDPKCLSCGSDTFIEMSMNEQPDTIIGYDDLPNCENSWIVPNPVGVIVSLQASCVEETPFIKWKQLILRSVLQSKFPGMEFSSSTSSIELRYITDQQKATPAGMFTNGFEEGNTNTTGRELELLEFQQIWLDYPVYCNVKFDEDMPLARGKTLPKGKTLGEAYPNGFYFARVGDIVPDMWNEDKNRKWTSSPYGMRPGSMYGTGSAIALSQQELINDLKTLEMANAWSNGVPREFVDPAIIKELSADPQIPTNVDMSGADGDIIGRAYAQAAPQALSAEVYGLEDNAKSSMQNIIGAMSGQGAGGLQDSQKWGDTATAISIKRDLAVGRFSPDLELMADQLDRQQAYQFLENEQQYFTPRQWEKLKGDFGDEALKAFLACDIRRDLIITISPGSYMPKSDAQMQAKTMAYSQVLPIFAQMQNPELIAYAAEVFGIPEHLGGWNSDRAYAGRVVKRFEALAELFIEQYGDAPTNDLEDPTVKAIAQRIDEYSKMPVDVFLDNHEALIDAYRDWRTTDEGRDAPNVLIAAVALRALKHQEGIAKQGQLLARTQQAAMEPLQQEAEAQQAAMMQQQQQADADAVASQDEATQLEAVNKLAEFNDKDEERAARATEQDKEHAHKEKLEAMKLLAAHTTAKDSDGKNE